MPPLLAIACLLLLAALPAAAADKPIDFNRDIRPILSNNCIFCHGPDEDERKADLRLDTLEGALFDLGGYAAIIPGDPARSELLHRVTATEQDDIMPPPDKSAPLEPAQIELLKKWIAEGAEYAIHWSYAPPQSPPLPELQNSSLTPIDHFIQRRLESENLTFSPEADRRTLARRLALDLTGLPSSWEEVAAFLADKSPRAYEKYVDALLARPAFGEHWARLWLDQARYADSSGYPSDQPREIWGYRDWVVDAFNANKPFDRFTIEQLAGDLLPEPTEANLIATAFHRNTMTQNEGGTDDEEFRNAAVIDRVNTTMEVWMGTTMACAQCHTHKFDPISQKEYFQVFAILNQSADSDKKDEQPLHEFFTAAQRLQREELQSGIDILEERFANPEAEDYTGLPGWMESVPVHGAWETPVPLKVTSAANAVVVTGEKSRISVSRPDKQKDTLTIELPLTPGPLEALRLEALAANSLPKNGPGHAGGNFVLSQLRAEFVPDDAKPVKARRLRITLPSDKHDFLALAEVQVFSAERNIARQGEAGQISTPPDSGGAKLAIDGNIDGNTTKGSVAVTGGGEAHQWWELAFAEDQAIDRIVVWKRTDKGQGASLQQLDFELFDDAGESLWSDTIKKKTFDAREEITVSGRREIPFVKAFADATQKDFIPSDVLAETIDPAKGWAVAGHTGTDRQLTLLAKPGFVGDRPGRLLVTLAQQSRFDHHTLGALRLGFSRDPDVRRLDRIPANILAALTLTGTERSAEHTRMIRDYYLREVSSHLTQERARLASLRKDLAAVKPNTLPIMQELPAPEHRVTRIQRRGSFLDLGDEVGPGVPEAFHPLPGDSPDRLALARWLVSPENSLTARVTVNRFWEAIFGIGIVETSEEFGSQGELPFHPELLDWLAVDFMENGWNVKWLLKQFVMSRAYRQDSRTTPGLNERDPSNRLLARGPRFRPTGEQLRDQALYVSGLLSSKMGGPAVRPIAPAMDLKTAFGRANDWTTSEGEDRHRRSLYTEVRRNAPYASFAAFDAPNREVCTIRRNRTNTPLQAFVTLNDPVFVEASQALARRILSEVPESNVAARLRHAFHLCLSRDPRPDELSTLSVLHEQTLAHFETDPEAAEDLATDPLGPAPKDTDLIELASWTTLSNVILNLDEFLMRR